MRPVAIDLCCGMGGWAEGLLAADFRCIGFDIKNWSYPGDLVLADVRRLDGHRFRGASLIVASPPCQEFSYRSFPFKQCRHLRDNVPPDTGIWEACVRIAKEAELPLVLENVRGAERYMGRAAARFGSYYLWGDVPVLLPDGAPRKGFYAPTGTNQARALHRSTAGRRMSKQQTAYVTNGERMAASLDAATKTGRDFAPEKDRWRDTGSKAIPWMERRRMWSAQVAKVPFELGFWVGQCFRGDA